MGCCDIDNLMIERGPIGPSGANGSDGAGGVFSNLIDGCLQIDVQNTGGTTNVNPGTDPVFISVNAIFAGNLTASFRLNTTATPNAYTAGDFFITHVDLTGIVKNGQAVTIFGEELTNYEVLYCTHIINSVYNGTTWKHTRTVSKDINDWHIVGTAGEPTLNSDLNTSSLKFTSKILPHDKDNSLPKDRLVVIRGSAKVTATGGVTMTLFTLANDYRPSSPIYWPIIVFDASGGFSNGVCTISTPGAVEVLLLGANLAANDTVYLPELTFLADKV